MFYVMNTDTNEIVKVRAETSMEAAEIASEEYGWPRVEAWR